MAGPDADLAGSLQTEVQVSLVEGVRHYPALPTSSRAPNVQSERLRMHRETIRDNARLTLLRANLAVSSALLIVLVLGAFRRDTTKTRIDELTVERINVVEKDGRVRLVIANADRSPGVVEAGKVTTKPGGRAGLIFYNDEGNENGGLIFRGRMVDGKVMAGGHLSFDRYGQDQVIALTYEEEEGKHRQGLTILDRPPQSFTTINARRDTIRRMSDGPAKDSAWKAWALWQGGAPFGAPRLFVGRDQRKAATLDLKDQYGRSRLRLVVDSLGDSRIEFLNDSGQVIKRVQ